MFLKKISLVNFKNYAHLEVAFSSKINCFTGNNGAGKTNVLDAIYYLSFCKSYFTNADSMNVMHNEQLFVINGNYNLADKDEEIYCGFETGKRKRFKRNKKEYDKLADHIGLIPLVMITPYDINLILGGSDERRKFVDGIISQYDREYLYDLQRYNKALAQRNALLKEYAKTGNFDDDVIEIYDAQLVQTGDVIYRKRNRFIQELKPLFQKYFNHISQQQETVQLNYHSQLHKLAMGELLYQHKAKDKLSRYSTAGIHKDDVEFLLGDYPMRKIGSQGQQKSYLVALKLAQFEFIQKICGFKPILLLDDVFDKLDSRRVEQIIKLVADHSFGQIFITDTNSARIDTILNKLDGEYYHYHVTDAKLTRLNS